MEGVGVGVGGGGTEILVFVSGGHRLCWVELGALT